MKVFAVLALAGAAVAYSPCSGLNGNPVCCGTTILGLAGLNCNPRKFLFSRLLLHTLVVISFFILLLTRYP